MVSAGDRRSPAGWVGVNSKEIAIMFAVRHRGADGHNRCPVTARRADRGGNHIEHVDLRLLDGENAAISTRWTEDTKGRRMPKASVAPSPDIALIDLVHSSRASAATTNLACF